MRDLMITAATSSLETVTKVCALGSVLASHADGSEIPRSVNGCRWRSADDGNFTYLGCVQADALARILLQKSRQQV